MKTQRYVCPKCGSPQTVIVNKTLGPPICFPKYPHTTKAIVMKKETK